MIVSITVENVHDRSTANTRILENIQDIKIDFDEATGTTYRFIKNNMEDIVVFVDFIMDQVEFKCYSDNGVEIE